jgi:hypothetical protein
MAAISSLAETTFKAIRWADMNDAQVHKAGLSFAEALSLQN